MKKTRITLNTILYQTLRYSKLCEARVVPNCMNVCWLNLTYRNVIVMACNAIFYAITALCTQRPVIPGGTASTSRFRLLYSKVSFSLAIEC